MASNFIELSIENRYVSGVCIISLSCVGLLANIIIFMSRIPRKKTIISMNVASTVFLLPNFLVYLPCSTTFCPFYEDQTIVLFSSFDTIGYYSYQLSLLQVSVDRMLVFYSPRLSKFYQTIWIPFSVAIWTWVLLMTAVSTTFACQKKYNVEWLYFYFDVRSPTGLVFLEIFIFTGYTCTGVMVACYTAVVVRLRLQHKRMGSGRIGQEVKLMLQYLFICLFSLLGTVCFFFLDDLKKFFDSPLTLLPVTVSTIALTSHSYIFLLSNSKMPFKKGSQVQKSFRTRRSTHSMAMIDVASRTTGAIF